MPPRASKSPAKARPKKAAASAEAKGVEWYPEQSLLSVILNNYLSPLLLMTSTPALALLFGYMTSMPTPSLSGFYEACASKGTAVLGEMYNELAPTGALDSPPAHMRHTPHAPRAAAPQPRRQRCSWSSTSWRSSSTGGPARPSTARAPRTACCPSTRTTAWRTASSSPSASSRRRTCGSTATSCRCSSTSSARASARSPSSASSSASSSTSRAHRAVGPDCGTWATAPSSTTTGGWSCTRGCGGSTSRSSSTAASR